MRGHAVDLHAPLLPFTGTTDATRMASKLAAERAGLSAPTSRGRVLDYIRAWGGATDNEIADGLPMSGSTVRPRRIELLRAGLIEASGEKRKGCVVWRVR